MKYTLKPGSYELRVYDDAIDADTQSSVWNYLVDSEYCVNFYDQPYSNWYPKHNQWHTPRNHPAAVRCPFAWDEQIKEWCWWEEQGYFCHEHPSPQANQEFAQYLQPKISSWIKS